MVKRSMLKGLSRVLGVLLAIYTLVRFAYWAINHHFFASDSATQILKAFVVGIRFDLSAIAWLAAPLIPLIYFPLPWLQRQRPYQWTVRVLFTILQSAGLLSALVDIEFLQTTGRRLSYRALVDMQQDVGPQAGQLVISYWPLILSWLILTAILWRVSRHLMSHRLSALRLTGAMLLVGFFVFFFLRGGVQPKVLHPAHAFSMLETPTTADLALNGPLHMIRKTRAKSVQVPKFYATYDEALDVLKPAAAHKSPVVLPPQTNVVLFIVESLGAEYMGEDGAKIYTPFLSHLRKKSADFFGVANAGSSIQSLAPILLGVPSLMTGAYITSVYQNNQVEGVATNLRKLGYSTQFFHGGQKGTMYFDAYAKLAGFETYHGLEDYPDQKDFDGAWGIYDHAFLNFLAGKVQNARSPVFATIFTLSSHPPYRIPSDRQDRYPEGHIPIHKSFGYVDEAFRDFFEQHKNDDWFQNTLFVFTADHTQRAWEPAFQGPMGAFRIPIFFYHPKIDLSRYSDRTRVIQQADIGPSIYALLGHPEMARTPLARSVFGLPDKGHANFRLWDCVFEVVGGEPISYVKVCPQKTEGPFDFVKDPLGTKLLVQDAGKMETQKKRAEATAQVFFQGLVENRMLLPQKGK